MLGGGGYPVLVHNLAPVASVGRPPSLAVDDDRVALLSPGLALPLPSDRCLKNGIITNVPVFLDLATEFL